MSLNQVLRYIGFAIGSALTATVLAAATPAGAPAPAAGGYRRSPSWAWWCAWRPPSSPG